MRLRDQTLQLSATDLAGHLGCAHLTELEHLAAAGRVVKPVWADPMVEVLQKRGFEHEARYLEHLRAELNFEAVRIDPTAADAVDRTRQAMVSGASAIVQAALADGRWHGRADVLLRTDGASDLGPWSYEVVDTKLASETRAGTILQLCLYSEMVGHIQGTTPKHMWVVSPGRLDDPERYRTSDFLAFHRRVKDRLLASVADGPAAGRADDLATYPEPVAQCEYCSWWSQCDGRRRADDHLSLVAGVTRLHRRQLVPLGYDTVVKLADAPMPFAPRPQRGSLETYERAREQARLQVASRDAEVPTWEFLDVEAGRGFTRLPAPSPGDVFFDFEGDSFVEGGGREYLFGWVELDADGTPRYERRWALTRADERREFESFVDRVTARLATHPDLHVYHFGAYEPGAFKRLMGRYATREDEIDRWLRAGRLVDLHAVVRQGLRVGVETYGLKQLEPLHAFTRTLDLREASRLLRGVERALELEAFDAISDESRAAVEAYNRDDCLSTLSLRDWLEERRTELERGGAEVPRPVFDEGDPSQKIEERQAELQELFDALMDGVPAERDDRSDEEKGRWLLAHLLDWHRREGKATWWEFFHLAEMSEEELLEEKAGLGGLEFVERLTIKDSTDKCPVDRYRFPEQEHGIRVGKNLRFGKTRLGTVHGLDDVTRTIDIKKSGKTKDEHPTAVFMHDYVPPGPKPRALARIAKWVLENGVDTSGSYRAARDLLLRQPPRRADMAAPLVDSDVALEQGVRRLVQEIEDGVLPVQGPPGAGKTYLGARMICELVRAGKRVGVTATSHKVIHNLLRAVTTAAKNENFKIRCATVKESSDDTSTDFLEVPKNEHLLGPLDSGAAQVAGGTAWAWAREEFEEAVDVLVVDEAGQMSLADTLAAATAAKSVVLLGDPQQLEQPIQGSHPDGCAASALEHLLAGEKTMPAGRGLFLPETWRLHPSICAYTSELFYEGRLGSHQGCDRQEILGDTPFAGAGLHWARVAHEGNQSVSPEEVDQVASIFDGLTSGRVSWRNSDGEEAVIGLEDVLVVAPYNLQVTALAKRLPPGARVGTVDKFQGQEAPVVLYSLTTSTAEDAPRGMEFLYSLNRLNVATSRARCAVILVGSPRLLEAECRSPGQMRLANALCGFGESAKSAGSNRTSET